MATCHHCGHLLSDASACSHCGSGPSAEKREEPAKEGEVVILAEPPPHLPPSLGKDWDDLENAGYENAANPHKE